MLKCPVCSSAVKQILFKVPCATVSNCAHCSHTFSHNVECSPSEIYIEDYFKIHHKNWFENPNYALFNRLEALLLREFGKKDISVLDVGSGNGDFLRHLHSRGFTNLTGIDFSPSQHESIQFLQGDIFAINEHTFGRKFDAVISLLTIEHVEDIHKFTKILQLLTKIGGILCIVTNDESSLIYTLAKYANKLGLHFGVDRLYDKHHLNHFTKKSLKICLEKNSKLKVVDHYGINFPFAAIDLSKSPLNFIIKPAIISLFILTDLIKHKQFLQVIVAKAT